MLTTEAKHTTAAACYGAEDADGQPVCEGPDVQRVHAEAPGGQRFSTLWCSECRNIAEADGYRLLEVTPTEY